MKEASYQRSHRHENDPTCQSGQRRSSFRVAPLRFYNDCSPHRAQKVTPRRSLCQAYPSSRVYDGAKHAHDRPDGKHGRSCPQVRGWTCQWDTSPVTCFRSMYLSSRTESAARHIVRDVRGQVRAAMSMNSDFGPFFTFQVLMSPPPFRAIPLV